MEVIFMGVIFNDAYSGNMRVYNDTGESEWETRWRQTAKPPCPME
jgi:hypothetical protein